MKDSKGFSYVEMILVLAISAITIGMVSISVGMISRNNVNKSVDKLMMGFKQSQSSTLAKGENKGRLVLYYEDGSYYYRIGDDSGSDANSPVEFATRPCQVEFVDSTSGNVFSIDGTGEFKITYNPSNGSIKNTQAPFDSIVIYNGNKSSTMNLISKTGNVIVN